MTDVGGIREHKTAEVVLPTVVDRCGCGRAEVCLTWFVSVCRLPHSPPRRLSQRHKATVNVPVSHSRYYTNGHPSTSRDGTEHPKD